MTGLYADGTEQALKVHGRAGSPLVTIAIV
jgi:hypothetical protein